MKMQRGEGEGRQTLLEKQEKRKDFLKSSKERTKIIKIETKIHNLFRVMFHTKI